MNEAPALQLDGTHKVLTPEYVEFDFVLAGIYARVLAWLIDFVVAMVLFWIVVWIATFTSLVTAFAGDSVGGFGGAFLFIAWFLIDWFYAIFLEMIWSGQTVGKKVMGLRVIQESGVRVDPVQSAIRNLIRPVDRLPLTYLVGGIAALFSKSHQRLGDMAAGTVVVRERRLKIPASLSRPEGDTSLLNDPDFRARVAKLTAEEEALFFSAAIRREELGMEARLNLFATLSQRLQDDLGFFKPEHLSDEKLVLLVTAAAAARQAEKRGRPLKPKAKGGFALR
jgi:uncharacterized RDD family membrane protein YckC